MIPSVRRVERDIERSTDAQPSDPRYHDQWSLPRIGWDVARERLDPTGRTVVAILDTGVDPPHPDLEGQLLPGVSFVDGIAADTDPNGHGTWMAGIVAAETDNDRGIAGVAWSGVNILPVTVLGPTAPAATATSCRASCDATDAGRGRGPDGVQRAGLLSRAPGRRRLRLGARRGRRRRDRQRRLARRRPTRPAIAASSASRRPTATTCSPPGSNSGPAVFMAAPGVDILTTDAGGGYQRGQRDVGRGGRGRRCRRGPAGGGSGASNGTIVGRLARDRPRRPARASRPATAASTSARAAADRDTTAGHAARRGGDRPTADRSSGRTWPRRRATWTGGGGDNNWTTAANWGGTAPVAGDDLVFPAGAARLTQHEQLRGRHRASTRSPSRAPATR